MSHFVCKGECNGVSKEEGSVCLADNCSKRGEVLSYCSCGDDKHGSAQSEDTKEGDVQNESM